MWTVVTFVVLVYALDSVAPQRTVGLVGDGRRMCSADVGFILDSSGSLREDYHREKEFLKAVARRFGIGNGGETGSSRLGVVTFSYRTKHSIKLNEHNNLAEFNTAVDNIPIMGHTTRIDKALRLAQDQMFRPENGGRAGAKKIVVLLTDGSQTKSRSDPGEDPHVVAEQMRVKNGITIVVIGIGSEVEKDELLAIAGREDHLFMAKTFDVLVSEAFINSIQIPECIAEVKEPECNAGGNTYRIGDIFMDGSCRRCECYVETMGPERPESAAAPMRSTAIRCSNLCEGVESAQSCANNQKRVMSSVLITGTQCQCEKATCVTQAPTCSHGGRSYNIGESFMDGACRRCQCVNARGDVGPLAGGSAAGALQCTDYCMSVQHQQCTVNQKQVMNPFPIQGTSCTCQRKTCVNVGCNVGGRLYAIGQIFQKDTCTRCECHSSLRHTCTPLCPVGLERQARCGENQKEIINRYIVPGSQCNCPKRTCVDVGCNVAGRLYGVGTTFMTDTCTRCTCKGPNDHACAPLCTMGLDAQAKCSATQREVIQNYVVPGTSCQCPKRNCVDIVCNIAGRIYRVGQTFMRDPCTKCQCQGENNHRCEPLCAVGLNAQPRCGAQQREVITANIIAGSACNCPKRSCVDIGCNINGRTYKLGENYMRDACTRCQCQGPNLPLHLHECKQLCQVGLEQQPKCATHQRETITDNIIEGSQCNCPKRSCVDVVCNAGGNSYRVGETFMIDVCTKCQCYGENNHRCTPLCPVGLEAQPRCSANQKEVITANIIPESKCNCPKRSCVDIVCNFGGNSYRVGETFMKDACSKCQCYGANNHRCTPLCPTGLDAQPRCSANQKEVITANIIDGSSCNCPTRSCVDIVCNVAGNSYRVGETFMIDACSKCQCRGENDHQCTPLCPVGLDAQPRCSVYQKEVISRNIIPGSKCNCPKRNCIDTGCNVNGSMYKLGDHFMRDACSKCQCQGPNLAIENHECRPLCIVGLDQQPKCSVNQREEIADYIISGSQCNCPKRTCVDIVCNVGGKAYRVGETFTTDACTKCQCYGADNHRCTPLCPVSLDAQPRCASNQREVITTTFVAGSSCNCPKRTCVDLVCNVAGKSYKLGQTFMSGACKKCQCVGDNNHRCVPLCPMSLDKQARCSVQQREVISNYNVPGTQCNCPQRTCVDIVCQEAGRIYRVGQAFMRSACTKCKCLGSNNSTCTPLCPVGLDAQPKCGRGQREVISKNFIPGTSCDCPKRTCIDIVCDVGGVKYKVGQTFMSDACTKCQCQAPYNVPCVPLCKDRLWAQQRCQAHQREIIAENILPGTKCNCPKRSCVDIVCTVDGKTYRVGETFMKTPCTRCQCQGVDNFRCEPLCPTMQGQCAAHQRTVMQELLVPGTKCKCSKKTCVDQVCKLGNRIFRVGQSFMADACNKCQCLGENNHKCTSVCAGSMGELKKSCGKNQREVIGPMMMPGTLCTCPKKRCINLVCVIGGRTISMGQSIMADACTRCSCYGANQHRCVPICRQPDFAGCSAGQRPVATPYLIPGTNCNCPKRSCVAIRRPVVQPRPRPLPLIVLPQPRPLPLIVQPQPLIGSLYLRPRGVILGGTRGIGVIGGIGGTGVTGGIRWNGGIEVIGGLGGGIGGIGGIGGTGVTGGIGGTEIIGGLGGGLGGSIGGIGGLEVIGGIGGMGGNIALSGCGPVCSRHFGFSRACLSFQRAVTTIERVGGCSCPRRICHGLLYFAEKEKEKEGGAAKDQPEKIEAGE